MVGSLGSTGGLRRALSRQAALRHRALVVMATEVAFVDGTLFFVVWLCATPTSLSSTPVLPAPLCGPGEGGVVGRGRAGVGGGGGAVMEEAWAGLGLAPEEANPCGEGVLDGRGPETAGGRAWLAKVRSLWLDLMPVQSESGSVSATATMEEEESVTGGEALQCSFDRGPLVSTALATSPTSPTSLSSSSSSLASHTDWPWVASTDAVLPSTTEAPSSRASSSWISLSLAAISSLRAWSSPSCLGWLVSIYRREEAGQVYQ